MHHCGVWGGSSHRRYGVWNKLWLVIFFVVAYAAQAYAKDECADYVGKEVKAQSFDAVVSRFHPISPKGEFETTDQYRKRVFSGIDAGSGPYIITKEPNRVDIEYDADAGVLIIKQNAFNKNWMNYRAAIEVAGFSKNISANEFSFGNVASVFSVHEEDVGVGDLLKKRDVNAVFERNVGVYDYGMFKKIGKNEVVGKLPVAQADAKRIKQMMRLAFVVYPVEPYFISGSYKDYENRRGSVKYNLDRFSILVADFKCGLVLDGAKVLGAYITR